MKNTPYQKSLGTMLMTSVSIASLLAIHSATIKAAETTDQIPADQVAVLAATGEKAADTQTEKTEQSFVPETPAKDYDHYEDVTTHQPNGAAANAESVVEVPKADAVAEDQTVTIENQGIRESISIKDGKFHTDYVENKLTDDRLTFEDDSKDFVLQFRSNDAGELYNKYVPRINELKQELAKFPSLTDDKKDWQFSATSHAANEGIENAFDGNVDTIWHNNYGGGEGEVNTMPQIVTIDFNTPRDVQTIMYIGRQDVGVNGLIKDYEVEVQKAGSDEFTKIKSGVLENTKQIQFIDLGQQVDVKSLRLIIKSDVNNYAFASAAEIDVSDKDVAAITKQLQDYAQNVAAPLAAELQALQEEYAKAQEKEGLADPNRQISTDRLTVKKDGVHQETQDGMTRTTFTFNPIQYNNTTIEIRYNIVSHEDEDFVQKFLEFKTLDGNPADAVIDYIDLMSYSLPDGTKEWHLPAQQNINEMAGFNGYYAGLGQPVYLSSFYTGSEFPATENTVKDGVAYARYFSGKSLAQWATNDDGYAQAWNTVIGAAHSDQYEVIQQDFYNYIRRIGTGTKFRKQYNSWFDHMTNINADNIQESFNEIERGFTANGVSPIDSFVVDDGWQDMKTLWDFNEKFPNKLYGPSKQVQRLGSNFGLWMGPQGGYSNPGAMADALVAQNLASKNAGVIYIGDKRYTDGLRQLFENYDQEFDINYWKLDGLLLNPRPDTDSDGNFIGGGYRNMYSMTETHERWIGLYNAIRNSAKDPDNMWINLTSYIMPSPWFLQWVDSVWMQNTSDVGYEDGVKGQDRKDLDFGNDMNETLTFRDRSYEQLVNTRQWQLPFSNIYNHDPIYGMMANSGKVVDSSVPSDQREPRPQINFSTDDMRTYLYFLGTRGTGFFEYYLSYDMLTSEHWQVIGEATRWMEENFDILRNAKFHGGQPGQGEVYGYSAWDEHNGILSMRNPIQNKQTYTITLDETIGVHPGTENLTVETVLGDKAHDTTKTYKYGDTLTIELNPYEALIYQFSDQKDETPANIYYTQVVDDHTINMTFDEHVVIDNATFTVNGEKVEATLQPNFRTVTLKTANALKDGESVAIAYNGLLDNAADANEATGETTVVFHTDQRAIALPEATNGMQATDAGIEGRAPFTVSAKVTVGAHGGTIASQGDQWSLKLTDDGKVAFTVGDTTVESAPFAELHADDKDQPDQLLKAGDQVFVSAVRNPNGSLRLFINGELVNTAYNAEDINKDLERDSIQFGTVGFDGKIENFSIDLFARDFETAADDALVRGDITDSSVALEEIPEPEAPSDDDKEETDDTVDEGDKDTTDTDDGKDTTDDSDKSDEDTDKDSDTTDETDKDDDGQESEDDHAHGILPGDGDHDDSVTDETAPGQSGTSGTLPSDQQAGTTGAITTTTPGQVVEAAGIAVGNAKVPATAAPVSGTTTDALPQTGIATVGLGLGGLLTVIGSALGFRKKH
ncbi:discoidin domain-containing protein [Aerococcus vaginalis]